MRVRDLALIPLVPRSFASRRRANASGLPSRRLPAMAAGTVKDIRCNMAYVSRLLRSLARIPLTLRVNHATALGLILALWVALGAFST